MDIEDICIDDSKPAVNGNVHPRFIKKYVNNGKIEAVGDNIPGMVEYITTISFTTNTIIFSFLFRNAKNFCPGLGLCA